MKIRARPPRAYLHAHIALLDIFDPQHDIKLPDGSDSLFVVATYGRRPLTTFTLVAEDGIVTARRIWLEMSMKAGDVLQELRLVDALRSGVLRGTPSERVAAAAVVPLHAGASLANAGSDRDPLVAVESSITICVCTRDRPDDIRSCLESIAVMHGQFDVLVIDNAPSNDRTESIVKTTLPKARYVREDRPGLD